VTEPEVEHPSTHLNKMGWDLLLEAAATIDEKSPVRPGRLTMSVGQRNHAGDHHNHHQHHGMVGFASPKRMTVERTRPVSIHLSPQKMPGYHTSVAKAQQQQLHHQQLQQHLHIHQKQAQQSSYNYASRLAELQAQAQMRPSSIKRPDSPRQLQPQQHPYFQQLQAAASQVATMQFRTPPRMVLYTQPHTIHRAAIPYVFTPSTGGTATITNTGTAEISMKQETHLMNQ
jgi:hypothetical protein